MNTAFGRVVVVIIVCFCLAQPHLLAGTVYYTALNGNNLNPGTEALPFRTIKHGVTKLTAGDTLYVKSGTYNESILSWQTQIPVGTSWDNPVTVAVNPGDSVTVRPFAGQAFFWLKGEQIQNDNLYLVIDGFTIDGGNQALHGFKFTGSSKTAKRVRVQNTEIKNTVGSGILLTTPSVAQSPTYHEFINVSSHGNGGNRFDHGIYIATSNNLVKGGEYYSNQGYGIHQFNSSSTGIPTNNNVIDGVIVYDNNQDPNSTADAGIVIGSGSGNVIKNSVITGGMTGKQGYGISVGFGASDNNQIYNNTIVGNRLHAVEVSPFGTVSNTQIKNNIFWNNGTDSVRLYGNQSNTIQSNNLNVDPLFANAAGGDFHLLPSSSAKDSGANLGDVTKDFDGVLRPQGAAHDIGAFELTPVESADFDEDGDVDGRDFLVWQRGYGSGNSLSEGDANGDGLVNSADLTIWEGQYGATALASTLAIVPEPSSLAATYIAIALLLSSRARRCFQ